MRVDQVNKLMWVACMSELYGSNLFGLAGSICDCGMSTPKACETPNCSLSGFSGIKTVEEMARNCREIVRSSEEQEAFKLPGLPIEQFIEFGTRCLVREAYEEIFGVSAAEPTIKALWKVLDKIYPSE